MWFYLLFDLERRNGALAQNTIKKVLWLNLENFGVKSKELKHLVLFKKREKLASSLFFKIFLDFSEKKNIVFGWKIRQVFKFDKKNFWKIINFILFWKQDFCSCCYWRNNWWPDMKIHKIWITVFWKYLKFYQFLKFFHCWNWKWRKSIKNAIFIIFCFPQYQGWDQKIIILKI